MTLIETGLVAGLYGFGGICLIVLFWFLGRGISARIAQSRRDVEYERLKADIRAAHGWLTEFPETIILLEWLMREDRGHISEVREKMRRWGI